MKVKELIEKLQQLDPEAVVVHEGYEDGYNVVSDRYPLETTVYPRIGNEDHWWCGDYEEVTDWDDFYSKRYDQNSPLRVVIV